MLFYGGLTKLPLNLFLKLKIIRIDFSSKYVDLIKQFVQNSSNFYLSSYRLKNHKQENCLQEAVFFCGKRLQVYEVARLPRWNAI